MIRLANRKQKEQHSRLFYPCGSGPSNRYWLVSGAVLFLFHAITITYKKPND